MAHAVNVQVFENGHGPYSNTVTSGAHTLNADEPADMGGLDSGPNPYDFVAIGLGACTSMTLRMYADRKGWDVGKIHVTVTHHKDADTKRDVFTRTIAFSSASLTEDSLTRLLEIADKCPVHKTLSESALITTTLA
jgi:putative redox protein